MLLSLTFERMILSKTKHFKRKWQAILVNNILNYQYTSFTRLPLTFSNHFYETIENLKCQSEFRFIFGIW